MTPTSKAQKLEELFTELEPIRAELNALLYDASNKLRWDTTPEEDARIDELAAQSDEIARRITATTVEEAHPDQVEKIIDLLKELETRIPYTPKEEETMTDQTTHITPKLALEKDAYGVPEILLDGETIGEYVYGGNDDENMQEMFRILTSMTYARRNGTYWADWRGGEDFWASGISLHDAVEQAAKGIALFLTGQNGYPLFGEKTSLKAVK